MVIALRLPPRADSDPPEAVPRPLRTMLRLRRGNDRPLSGKLVIATLIGSATLRALYGFLLLFFAFAIKADQLDTTLLGKDIGSQGAVALVGGSLVVGTFLSTAIGTRLRIRRPLALQSSGLVITAGVAVLAVIFYNLPMIALLALVTAIFSGIGKLAIDASIQERVPERLRASAFAHSETVLMIAWVAGGAVGIIKMNGHLGVIVAAAFAVAAAVRAGLVAARLHNEKLSGAPTPAEEEEQTITKVPAAPDNLPPTDPWPTAPTVAPQQATAPAIRRRQPSSPDKSDTTLVEPEPGAVKREDRTVTQPPPAMAPPGYHVYRPSSASTEPPPDRDEK